MIWFGDNKCRPFPFVTTTLIADPFMEAPIQHQSWGDCYQATQGASWKSLEQLELATLEWVWWFNHKRLLESNGYIPPAEYEEAFHSRNETHTLDAVLT